MGLTGIPFIDNALGDGPAQQAQAVQSTQNAAQQTSTSAAQLGQAQQLYAALQMMMQYQNYIKQNPNPAQTWAPIRQPQQVGPATLGGGTIASNGSPAPQNAGTGAGGGMFSLGPNTPMQQPQMPPQNLSASMGIPMRYLQGMGA